MTEISSKKWTPVPRGKATGPADDDGDEEYDPNAKGEKYTKEMLPFKSSRPDFMTLFLGGIPVPTTARTPTAIRTHATTHACHHTRTTPHTLLPQPIAI